MWHMDAPLHTMSHTKDSRTAPQPLAVVQIDDALLRKATVSAITGLSSSSVDRKTAQGVFPKPIKMGARCTRWRAGDVRKWLADQAAGVAA